TENDHWYIARGDQQLGPFTVFELKEMGMAGKVEVSDVVWKEGMPNRIPATRVKGLLPAALVAAEQPGSMDAEAPAKTAEEEKQERQQAYKKRLDLEIRPRRVTGIKGAIVLSQDGKDARNRNKCIRCGTEDNKPTL